MVKLTQSLSVWLFNNHPDKLAPIMFGHTELYTPDMHNAYLGWCQTNEGKRYLKGGDLYREDIN